MLENSEQQFCLEIPLLSLSLGLSIALLLDVGPQASSCWNVEMLKCWINPVTVHFRCWNGNYRIYPPGLFASCLPFAIYQTFFFSTYSKKWFTKPRNLPTRAFKLKYWKTKLKIEKWWGRKWNFKTLTLWKYLETSLIWTTCQPYFQLFWCKAKSLSDS